MGQTRQKDQKPSEYRRAIFLDRDGVINRKLPPNHYVGDVGDFHFLPGAIDALAMLRELGFALIVVTNQRGIARGLMTEEDLHQVHDMMQAEILKKNVVLDGIYWCPHEEFENCSCRKPEPGMILRGARDLGIDLRSSYMVGDSPADVEAGRRSGTRTVFIGEDKDADADMIFPRLIDFARYLRERGTE
ncbi:MAG: HAD family hydrolase [Deltaproteobacteria bacterium]